MAIDKLSNDEQRAMAISWLHDFGLPVASEIGQRGYFPMPLEHLDFTLGSGTQGFRITATHDELSILELRFYQANPNISTRMVKPGRVKGWTLAVADAGYAPTSTPVPLPIPIKPTQTPNLPLEIIFKLADVALREDDQAERLHAPYKPAQKQRKDALRAALIQIRRETGVTDEHTTERH